jgi:hypothetical protein
LVEESEYLVNLSRYIHRNPIETKTKIVKEIEDYKWSSYPSYLSLTKPTPTWLNKEKTLKMFGGVNDPIINYKTYVNCSDKDNSIAEIYQNYHIPSILGSKNFKEKILFEKLSEDGARRDLVLNRINKNKKLTTYQIVGLVSEIFSVNEDFVINRNKKGRQSSNIPRAFAMFLCQEYQDLTLSQIANFFNLSNPKSASNAICRIRYFIKNGEIKKELEMVKSHLEVVQVA